VRPRWGEPLALVVGLGGVPACTAILRGALGVTNPTIAALTFLLLILVVASASSFRVAAFVSGLAMLAFNYYFLPPVGTWTIADPQNWVALFVFLAVSLIASNLSATSRARAAEAEGRRIEMARLFDLSRDILMVSDDQALQGVARSVVSRFSLDYCAIAMPDAADWKIIEAGRAPGPLDRELIARTFASAAATLEFDARERVYGGHATQRTPGGDVRLVPLRSGGRTVGLLAAAGRPIEPGTLDVLGGIVAIGIERVTLSADRRAAALTRQSEELKTALLASMGHDLRTPLTAIRVAATNLQGDWLPAADRRVQLDLILTEVERLTRLFQNLLAMAHIDAGPVLASMEPALPSEIVAAARDQVEQALRDHHVDVRLESDIPVRLDPRLTATALAHVLENAAQYSPPGSKIAIAADSVSGEWRVSVHDSGPGLSAADLPRLFDRFYRGSAAVARTSGTGMGLSIARGLLAAEKGRIWAENDPQGGAVFTIAVPIR
jgi:two-component system sensor histidine kinase KdpD